MQKIITKIKNRSIWIWEIIRDPILRCIYPQPKIATMEETIREIIEKKASIARYGDGELDMIKGKAIPFQEVDEKLSAKLAHILQTDDEHFLVGLSDIFGKLDFYKKDTRIYWKRNIRKNRRLWYKYLKKNKQYYNTYISRFYNGFKDKSHCAEIVAQLKMIWEGRDLLIVEGEKSRLGVGNDLFAGALTLKRILCPPINAFSSYDEIIDAVKKYDKNHLILLALGPTATAMAYDLYILGYQALDIGHIDIEYEWYLMKAETKVAIKDKYTNEATTSDAIQIGESSDKKYLSEVVEIVKN